MIALFVFIRALLFATLELAGPSPDDVLAMMRQLPNECALYKQCPDGLAGFDLVHDAREIAEAIADGVKGEVDPWGRAALGAVYSSDESANQRCRVGDGGQSVGAWQMKGLSKDAACTPAREFPLWLAAVRRSEAACAHNAPDERLAALASGSCDHGRQKVRFRAVLARKILPH